MDLKEKAEGLLKKPFLSFNWEPDYESVGIYYQKAANQLASSDVKTAIECYELATEHLLKGHIPYEAAKSQELLAKLLKRQGDQEKSVGVFVRSGDLYAGIGQYDTASDMYMNSAMCAKESDEAIKYYKKCITVLVENEKGLLANDKLKRATTYAITNKAYEEAKWFYKQSNQVYVENKKPGNYTAMSIVILALYDNNVEEARAHLNDCTSQLGVNDAAMALLGTQVELPSELAAALALLEAYEQNNQETWSSILSEYTLSLDSALLRLANTIQFQQDEPTSYTIDEEEGFA